MDGDTYGRGTEPLKAHGPDVPPCWFFIWGLPVQSAASYGRGEPLTLVPVKLWASRN